MNKTILALMAAASVSMALMPGASAFTHPGIPLTNADLAAVKAKVAAGEQPWKAGYDALAAERHSQLTYNMQGPFAQVSRGGAYDENLPKWRNDMTAIWNLARMWYFTGNEAYAQKAHGILLAWANTQTEFSGGESPLELGECAYRFVGGADILRGTWPGWTDADTAAVKNYFGNILLPATSPYGESMFGAANKGTPALVAAGLISIFNDDTARLNTIVYQVRTLAHVGLRSSNDLGMLGDSGRDQGHAHGQLFSLAMLAEAVWKQGMDIYSDYNNRLLAVGEYFARVNHLAPTPFLPFGSTDAYFTGDNTNRGWGGGNVALNLIHGAYVVRMGFPAPHIALRRQEMPVDGDSFMFHKEADTSVAMSAPTLLIPTTTAITSGLADVEIGGASPAGDASYSEGVWTVQGGGSEMWGTRDSCHFAYKAVAGNCAIIARVDSVQNTSLSAKAGVMMRSSLSAGATRAWMAITNRIQAEQNMQGLAVHGSTNQGNKAFNIASPSYWVKLERLGNIITGYVSPDGTNWTATNVGRYDNMPATLYVGLVVCSVANGTLNTSTFSNVQITGGNGGAPVDAPAPPSALLAASGEGAVSLRWQPSCGATSYTVKRATSSGGAYSILASGISSSSYTDTTVASGATYYYAVTASNAAGTSSDSPEDIATPQYPMLNVAVDGTVSDSANNPNGSEGAAKAFDKNPGSKWLSPAVSWLQYDFGPSNTQTIKRYTVTSADDVPTRDPKSWQFQGSSNGSTWITLDTRSNQRFATRMQASSYIISRPASYRYYRLNVTANHGDASTQISELGLFTDQGCTIRNGTYRLLSRKSNKALTAPAGNASKNMPLVYRSFTGGQEQQWTFTYLGNGQYKILNAGSNKVMDVSDVSTANGAGIHLWGWLNANNQKWTVTPTGDGFFKLTAVHSGKVADVNAGSIVDGTPIIQWSYGGGTHQQWSITTAP